MKEENKKNFNLSILKRIGYSSLFLVAILSAAGLLLGVGTIFTSPTIILPYKLEGILGNGTFLNYVFNIIKHVGNVVFHNLPIIFAICISIQFAKNSKETATISSVISFLVMHQTISTLLNLAGKLKPGAMLDGTISEICGIKSLETGIFSGILIGFMTAWLHNKFYKIKLPKLFSFFEGVRFVPIISSFVAILFGILMYFLWPLAQEGIYRLGFLVTQFKYTGTFVFGLVERILIPFGLHHVFYLPFWQTNLGGSLIIDGNYVTGAMNIFIAEMSSPNVLKFSEGASRFMSGKYPFMIFGLPSAALAMYKCAKSEKKKIVGSLLISAAFVTIFTGVTEPLEFIFLFASPMLYIIHCMLAGLSFMLMHILKVCVGMTFSGGIIEFLFYGVLQGNLKTKYLYAIFVGVGYFVVYYILFKFYIKKFNKSIPQI